MTYTMSIETAEGVTERHGFHLGTIERVAREIVVERFAARRKEKLPTVTIALLLDGKIVDVYAGEWWQSEKRGRLKPIPRRRAKA